MRTLGRDAPHRSHFGSIWIGRHPAQPVPGETIGGMTLQFAPFGVTVSAEREAFSRREKTYDGLIRHQNDGPTVAVGPYPHPDPFD